MKGYADQIVDIWINAVDPHPIIARLRKCINNIVDKNDMDPKQLLFHLTWCLNNGWHLRYPEGLYHVAKCEEAAEAWRKRNTKKIDEAAFVVDEDPKLATDSDFVYKPMKNGFGRILSSAT